MQKVMCIDDSEFSISKLPVPVVGETCTVVKQYIDVYDNNDPVFEFAEYGDHMFSQRYFATLPDATADEMQEEEQFIYDQFSC